MRQLRVKEAVDYTRLFIQRVSFLKNDSVDVRVPPNTEQFCSGGKGKCLVNCPFHLEKEGSGKGEGQRGRHGCPADRWHHTKGGDNRRLVGPDQRGCQTRGRNHHEKRETCRQAAPCKGRCEPEGITVCSSFPPFNHVSFPGLHPTLLDRKTF